MLGNRSARKWQAGVVLASVFAIPLIGSLFFADKPVTSEKELCCNYSGAIGAAPESRLTGYHGGGGWSPYYSRGADYSAPRGGYYEPDGGGPEYTARLPQAPAPYALPGGYGRFHPRSIPQPGYQRSPYAQSSASDYLADVSQPGPSRWSMNDLPIKVYIAPGTGVPGYRPAFRQMMVDAFNIWVQASGGKLAWQPVNDPRMADIICAWSPELPRRGNAAEAGHTVTRTQMNPGNGTAIIDLARVTIATTDGGRLLSDNEMRRVSLHEVGHAYGLQGHSPNFGDIMFPTTSAHQPPVLSQRDVTTIRRLYADYPSAGGGLLSSLLN